MKHPNPLMLLRIAQGDAYGLATEYVKFPRDQAVYDQALRFERYGRHPTHKLDPGVYSDDTQMSVAVTEVLLGDDHSREEFASAFVRCFKRDQRDGYARGFQDFLERVNDGTELLREIRADSDKNGAAMRSVPLGVIPDIEKVVSVATVQAEITHKTIGGTMASVLVALMSHFALYSDEPLSRLPDWLKAKAHAHLPRWDGRPVVGPSVGMNTARAVLTLVSEEFSLLDIAQRTIEWGGDTDSVLSIAWGIASTRMHEELPAFFEGGLENGPYGRTFLRDLGTKLMRRFHG